MGTSCTALQDRVILEELIISNPLPGRAIFRRTLPGALFQLTLPWANTGLFVYWEIQLSKRAIFKELIFNIPHLEMVYCPIFILNLIFTELDH